MKPVLDALRQLTALTEDQVLAARSLDGERLAALNALRVDKLFSLKLALASEGMPPKEPTLVREVRRLAVAEQRLAAIAKTVLDQVSRIDESAPAPVYDRAGLVRTNAPRLG